MLRVSCFAVILVVATSAANAQYGSYGHQYQAHDYVRIQTVIVPVVVPSTAYVNLSAPSYPATTTISPSAFERVSKQTQQGRDEMTRRLDAIDAKLSSLTAPAPALPAQRLSVPHANRTNGPPKLKIRAAPQQKIELPQIAGIFNQHCAACHTGTKAEENTSVRIFNDAGEYDPNVPVGTLVAAATRTRNPMPKSPNKVPPAQQRLLKLYQPPQGE